MLDLYRVSTYSVRSVEWHGDPIEYDLNLHSLGAGRDRFLVVNPEMENFVNLIQDAPQSDKCVVWNFENQWVAKHFTKNWNPEIGYEEIEIVKPKLIWRKNPDLDRTMTFEDDPFGAYEPEPGDWCYELVWYMDPRFNPLEDKVWALSCKPIGSKSLGIKDMGYVIPSVNIDINPDLTDIEVDLDSLCPAFWDLADECAYRLDPKHTPDQEMWVVKFTPAYRKPREWRWYGTIEPSFEVVYNPDLPKMNYELDYTIPWYDIGYDHVWNLDRCHLQNNEPDIWAFKIITAKESKGVKVIGEISPEVEFYTNSDLPDLDFDIEYITPWYDFQYEHIWMLDEKHLKDTVEKIWAVKASFTKKPSGSKIIDSVTPKIYKTQHPDLSNLEFKIDYDIPYHDLGYEHVWTLDPAHTTDLSEEIWAVKYSAVKDPQGTKKVGSVSPVYYVYTNPDLPEFHIPNIGKNVQIYDFDYTNVWMLDKEHSAGFDMWAVKVDFTKRPKGYKEQGFVTPGQYIEYNKDLAYINFKVDYKIPYHDREYLHVWYVDPTFVNGEKIWYAKIRSIPNATTEKEMGYVKPALPKFLDVIFISYNEPNADQNFERLRKIAPWAKRVNGVKGIFKAHKEAAKLSETDMFYVVDGDAEIVDGWKFNFQPNIFDRDCAYVWSSRNPINDLTYGYGGVKLFNKFTLMNKRSWSSLDMFTGIMPKLKVQSRVSNVTAFNTDAFSTWKSAFRECVKLRNNLLKNPSDKESEYRLGIWLTVGEDRPFGSYAIQGAKAAVNFVEQHKDSPQELKKINDYDWLKKEFEKIYV